MVHHVDHGGPQPPQRAREQPEPVERQGTQRGEAGRRSVASVAQEGPRRCTICTPRPSATSPRREGAVGGSEDRRAPSRAPEGDGRAGGRCVGHPRTRGGRRRTAPLGQAARRTPGFTPRAHLPVDLGVGGGGGVHENAVARARPRSCWSAATPRRPAPHGMRRSWRPRRRRAPRAPPGRPPRAGCCCRRSPPAPPRPSPPRRGGRTPRSGSAPGPGQPLGTGPRCRGRNRADRCGRVDPTGGGAARAPVPDGEGCARPPAVGGGTPPSARAAITANASA